MNRRLIIFILLLMPLSFLVAQNVGIGTNSPQDKLHVAGYIRSNALASPDTNIVLSNFNGTLINLSTGTSGQVLKSQGPGRAPKWSTTGLVNIYGVTATRTYINSTSPIQIGGLSQTITLTNNAVVFVTTHGSLETTSSFWAGSGCIVQIFLNGAAVTNAFQTVDVMDSPGFVNAISPWSFTSTQLLTPGTYTFTVRARMYGFDPFYAGGNFSAPNPNEGAMTVMVINQ